jgi:hypothetical protein
VFAFWADESSFQDMVDTESFEPDFTDAQLTKFMLGGISRRLDAEKTDAARSTSVPKSPSP